MKRCIALVLLLAAVPVLAWDPEVRLTENAYADFSYWSCQRRVALDADGRIHVIWYVMNSDLGTYKFQVYYKRFNPGFGWSQDTMLSADLYAANTNNKYPAICVDSSGRVVAAWGNDTSQDADAYVYYKTCVPEGSGNGGWDSVSRRLSNPSVGFTRECPNLAATPDGHVHAVWLEVTPGGGRCVAYRELIDTTWQAQVNLDLSGNYKVYPAVAGGTDNSVHVVWHGRNSPSGFYDVWYKARIDTTWGATENVSSGVRHQMYPSIAINPVTNQPHVLWQGQNGSSVERVVHAYRTAGGWQPRDTLSEPGLAYAQGTGQIAFTADGIGHAVWEGKSDSSTVVAQIRYSRRSAGGTWSAPANITDTTYTRDHPSITNGGNSPASNDLHVVWADYRDGNSEIYYKHDSTRVGMEEMVNGELTRVKGEAVIVRGSLFLPVSDFTLHYSLFSLSGQKLLDLSPGANDVHSLAPGVYFVMEYSVVSSQYSGPPAVTKVILAE